MQRARYRREIFVARRVSCWNDKSRQSKSEKKMNFKTEDGVLYYRKNVETGDKQEDSLWRICVRTCEDKMRILESCHAGLAGNEMMERCVLEQISDVSVCVCVCVCVCVYVCVCT